MRDSDFMWQFTVWWPWKTTKSNGYSTNIRAKPFVMDSIRSHWSHWGNVLLNNILNEWKGKTKTIFHHLQRCSNPQYLCTIIFRSGDGLNKNSLIRFTVYDVREKVSQTAVPLGSSEVSLAAVQETARLRIPLKSNSGAAGLLTYHRNSSTQNYTFSEHFTIFIRFYHINIISTGDWTEVSTVTSQANWTTTTVWS